MNEFRRSLKVAKSAGQMLGLAMGILLLTQTGRDYMGLYGWLNILRITLAVFLILELLVVLVANRMQHYYFVPAPASSPRPRLLS